MKLMKKIATMLLCVCLAVPCFSMISHAENNAIRFNDPTTKVGETVEVNVNMQTQSGVENIDITFSYDPTMLKFVSGENATETAEGTVHFEYAINWATLGTYNFTLKFEALKAGTTKITIQDENITSSANVNWLKGTSAVTIEEGDGTTVTDPAEDTEPTEGTEGTESTEQGTGDYEITISNSTSITMLMDVSSVILPEQYVETTVTVEGEEFPAWQDSTNTDMYILYATSSTGETNLYRYDTLENTYQRFEVTEATEEDSPLMAKVKEILGENTDLVILGAGVVFLLFVIILIVLSVKLYNRNAELDELYDEYGIDLDDEEESEKVKEEYETEDDVVLIADDEEPSNDEETEEETAPEVEVEFFVQESIKEFFDEETPDKVVAETETKAEVNTETEAEVKAEAESEEYYDDEEEFYDDLDGSFMVDFIDLDD